MSDSFAPRIERVPFLIASTLLVAASLALGGCNTIAGAGEDVEATGEAVTGASEDVQDEM